MTMKGSACKSSPKSQYHKFLKPGALAKLRDSKIIAKHYSRKRKHSLSLSDVQLLLPPSSPLPPIQEEQQSRNQDNGVPCFDVFYSVNLNLPRCLVRKKLFAVTPYFALPDEYQF